VGIKSRKKGGFELAFPRLPLDTAAALDFYDALLKTGKTEAGGKRSLQGAGFKQKRNNSFHHISNSCH
jgi:hypothetical protein